MIPASRAWRRADLTARASTIIGEETKSKILVPCSRGCRCRLGKCYPQPALCVEAIQAASVKQVTPWEGGGGHNAGRVLAVWFPDVASCACCHSRALIIDFDEIFSGVKLLFSKRRKFLALHILQQIHGNRVSTIPKGGRFVSRTEEMRADSKEAQSVGLKSCFQKHSVHIFWVKLQWMKMWFVVSNSQQWRQDMLDRRPFCEIFP